MNAAEYYTDENTRETIKNTLKFPNDYFMVVILQLSPKFQLFNFYSTAEYENIKVGFYDIVKDLFNSVFNAKILPGDGNALYIILNLENPNMAEKSNDILNQINDLLKNDMDYVNLSIGKSDTYTGIEGLKSAHKEASDNLMPFYDASNRVLINRKAVKEYDFDSREESDLFTALISMNKKKIYNLLNTIFERNKTRSNYAQKQLYISLVNITLNAIKIKKMQIPDNKTENEILTECESLQLHEIKKQVSYYVDYLTQNSEDDEKSFSELSNSIVDFINENFTMTTLSIDYLADYFHISAAGISVGVKNTLGIGFHEYLTTLRITKAKELLISTDESIADICQKCGFSRQQTFYRAIKKITGMTSSEIRKQQKKSDAETDSSPDTPNAPEDEQ